MKFVNTILILLLSSLISYAQLKGTTPVGRLIPEKEELKTIDKTSPLITPKNPIVANNDTINANNNIFMLSGSVSDESDSIQLFINNMPVKVTKENKFTISEVLNKGINSFQIMAADKYKNYSSLKFIVIYTPVIIRPEITILEPMIKEGNEISVEDKMLTIRGIVKANKGIGKILINNNNAELLNNGEFFFNYQLTYGKNNINITAFDIDGNSSDKNIIVNWSPDITGPIVKIIDPPISRGIKIVSKSDVVTIKGQAIDASGIYEVTINNREADLQADGDFSLNMYLQLGDNPLIVKAVDKKYNVTIDTFIVARKLESIITAGRYIALVIGIDSYSGYWPQLRNAVNDAEGVAKTLKNDYLFDTVITILDNQATRDNIIHELENLTNNVKSNDNLLIYYSGHGQFKKELNKGYWVPVDAKSNSIADFISNGDVKTFLGGIPAKHTLLISDACFAGDIFRGKPTESIPFDPNNMERYYKEVYSKSSRIAITSGGLEEVEDAGKEGHSIFTYYLLKSLKENQSRYLDAGQLFNDFRIAVTNNSEQTPLLQVVRDTGDEGGQFIFVRR